MSGKQPFISIIVPAYNVEAWLPQCLDSVIMQDSPDWECIVIDDCTPDGSGAIADGYAKRDPRVTVIHKPRNEGLCAARNSGIEAASGRYFLCLDGDDWLCENAVSAIEDSVRKHGDADTMIGTFCNFDERTGAEWICRLPSKRLEYSGQESYAVICNDVLPLAGTNFPLPGRCVFRLGNIRENKLTYDANGFEDMNFTLEALLSGRSLNFIEMPLYHYRIGREGAFSTFFSPKYRQGILNVILRWFSHFHDSIPKGGDAALRLAEYYMRLYVDHAASAFAAPYASDAKKMLRDEVRGGLASLRQSGLRPDSRKARLVYFVFCAFGAGAGGAILGAGIRALRRMGMNL
jgi:glycosyltransferase involved in cell wall biosynthesis